MPTVVFQEFSTETRCKSAKARLEDSLKDAGVKIKRGLEDLKIAGTSGPGEIIIAYNVECLQK